MKISYQIADESLGEKLFPNEEKIAFETADTIEKDLRKQYQTGIVKRDVHAKLTGLVKAEFSVNKDIPAHFAQGIFIPGKPTRLIFDIPTALLCQPAPTKNPTAEVWL